MADIIIKKKDVENFGKKVMKEVYKYLNDDDEFISIFINKKNIEEIEKEKDKIKKKSS